MHSFLRHSQPIRGFATWTTHKLHTNLHSALHSFTCTVFTIKSNQKRSLLLLNKVNELLKGKIKNKNICFLGVTFKANTDDMRDSSTLVMIPSLAKNGARINY